MKLSLRLKLLIVICIAAFSQLQATHLMGGEITWQCQGNGLYVFTLKLYRDCTGSQLNTNVGLRVHNHPTVTFIDLNLVSFTDISPVCNPFGTQINCNNPGAGAVQEYIFRSNPIALAGVPPPQGWVFTFDDCCRNSLYNMVINTSQTGFTLRAIMYANNGGDANPCNDSSPVFAQVPAIVICEGNPFKFNHNAYDPDMDSLAYDWAPSLDWLNGADFTSTVPPALIYNPGFSPSAPFPGPAENGSVPATLNGNTGEIEFTPNIQGNFVSVVKVSAYRCGQLLAEIFREIQVVVIPCGINNPPQITAPFLNPLTGLQTAFTDTVTAGDFVSFTIFGTDNEFLFTGDPQSIRITASGGQFGTGYISTTAGCVNPPCATLTPVPPVTVPNNSGITFNWQTSCSHILNNDGCYAPLNTHTFVLSFQDDFCPSPSYNIATISVVVAAPPLVPSPSLRCLEVLPGGDVQLTWIPSSDPENAFDSYHIFSSNSAAGPFTVVDSIFNLAQTTYTHAGAGAESGSVYYYIATRSGCDGQIFSPAQDTLQTLYLQVNDQGSGQIGLNWTPLSNPLIPSAQLPYRVFRELVPAAPALLNSVNGLTASDFMVGCLQDIYYQIALNDASGCVSRSNRDGGTFSNDQPPSPPQFDSVSVIPSGNQVILGWTASPSLDTDFYILYQITANDTLALDTVSASNLQAILPGLNPQNGVLEFAVSALDNCLEESALSPVLNSIWLQSEVLSCEGKVRLEWNTYRDSADVPASIYEIWYSRNGGSAQLDGVVNTLPGNNQIALSSPLMQGQTYCFWVRARAADGSYSSTSNQACFVADVQDLPDFTYLRRATVVNDYTVYTRCLIDTASDIAYYRIARKTWPSGYSDTLATLPLPGTTNTLEFTDSTAQTTSTSYEYTYLLIDKCNLPSGISNVGRTILLEGKADDGFVNRLQWNAYADWEAGVLSYEVFRSRDGGISYESLGTVGLETRYNDAVVALLDTQLRFCYQIRAIEQLGNSFNVRDTSWSNVLCVDQKPTWYIPSAFVPRDGVRNTEFKPIGLYESVARKHEFTIYNRWGERIFSTTDPKQAWDGTYQSSYVPNGVYVYHLKFELPDGTRVDERGAVMLID